MPPPESSPSAHSPASKKPVSRLGRGLSSLISVSDLPVEAALPPQPPAAKPQAATESARASTNEIPVDQVQPNPHQPRREMNESSLAELAASIKSTGLIQPIVVRKTDAGYQLIAGERRLRAAKLAGLRTLPAIVRDVDSFTQAQMALVENIQREDLNPIDRAHAYQALIAQLGLTQQELSGRLGEDRSTIANHLRLLDLAEPVRERIRKGELSLGHAKLLAGVPDILEQQRLADICVGQDLSVRNLERLIAGAPPTPAKAPTRNVSAHLADLEKTVARQLGMRVQIRGTKKGKIVIHYASLDQFDELMKRMNVTVE